LAAAVADIDIELAPRLLMQLQGRLQVRVLAFFGDTLDECTRVSAASPATP
jgi:hypothetical protein